MEKEKHKPQNRKRDKVQAERRTTTSWSVCLQTFSIYLVPHNNKDNLDVICHGLWDWISVVLLRPNKPNIVLGILFLG